MLPGDGDAELRALIRSLRETLRLGHLGVRSAEPGGAGVRVRRGRRVADPVPPLRNDGGVIGWVSASSEGHQKLDRRTRQCSSGISGVLSVALQLAAVNREIAEARDRALDVGDEERRMVRRELHDGLAPALHPAWPSSRTCRPCSTLILPRRRAIGEVRAEIGRAHERRARPRSHAAARSARCRRPRARPSASWRSGSRARRSRSPRRARGSTRLDPSRQVAVLPLVAEAVLLARRTPRVSRIGDRRGGQRSRRRRDQRDRTTGDRGRDRTRMSSLASICGSRRGPRGSARALERDPDGLRSSSRCRREAHARGAHGRSLRSCCSASWVPALASVVIAWAFELPDLPLPGAFLSASPPIVQSRFDDIGVVVAIIYGRLSALLIVRRRIPLRILAVHAVGLRHRRARGAVGAPRRARGRPAAVRDSSPTPRAGATSPARS